MRKICTTCKSIMNYDPYFEVEVCTGCGKIERKKSKEVQEALAQQIQRFEIEKQIFGVTLTH